MKRIYLSVLFATLLVAACSPTRNRAGIASVPGMEQTIDSVRNVYAPDKRTVLFDVVASGNVLTGKTNVPEAKTALLEVLHREHIAFIDSIRSLPDTSLGTNRLGVVSISVANLRVKAGHVNEMVTQATMGTPLKLLMKERGWYLVQTPDHYIAWTEGGGIKPMNSMAADQWQGFEKAIYIKPYGFAYASTQAGAPTISDLVYGDVVAFQKEENGFYETRFPDGRLAYIPSTEIILYKDWASTRNPTQENLVAASKQLIGIPYLWGGTSFKGVDCSGFTRTVYFMNGLLLPRDASQQATIGQDVDTKNGWQNLQTGDLLFFGMPARDGKPERVTHVGMWLGGENNEFIQSSSRVQISSFNPNAPNYDAGEHHHFLRARHITPRDVLYDLRHTTFY